MLFIWFGARFPVANEIAIRSAMDHCKPDECLLLCSGTPPEALKALAGLPGFEVRAADDAWFEGIPEGRLLRELFHEIEAPATRANLLRLAALWKLGGIYLDTDTITVRDLGPLRRHRGFCGVETVARPVELVDRAGPAIRIKTHLRGALRALCARTPGGDRAFDRVRSLYYQAVNNAVIGAEPQNPLVGRAFEAIAAMPSARRYERFRMGTHLMQQLTGNRSSCDMQVLPTDYFYPLGPEISLHWFRPGSAGRLPELVRPTTHVVHWYSSLEKRLSDGPITEAWITRHADTAFAELARPYLTK